VLGNPHLYPNPVLHTAHLFQAVTSEFAEAQGSLPQDAVFDPLERLSRVLAGSLVDGTLSGSREVPIEAGLAFFGAISLVIALRRGYSATGCLPPQGLVLLTALAYVVGISAGLYLAWPRYYIPTLLLGTLFSGLGVAALLRQVSAAIPRSVASTRTRVRRSMQ
jgi:hypothetical protein